MTTEELTQKVVELDERATRHTEQLKTVFNQIAEVKGMAESVYKLATTVEVLALEQKNTSEKIGTVAKDVDKVAREVEGIKEKPGKRWESVVTVVITAIVTGVVTFLLTRMGLS